MKELDLFDIISEQKLAQFLSRVKNTYVESVQYHNDLHGADVMQVAYCMLKMGLKESLNLNKLDCLSFIIAAVCHDLGHDGYNNSYHVNATTQRAIDSNDVSVQETFHASELFRILSNESCNFTDQFSK